MIEESLDPIQQTAEAAIAAADTPKPKPKPSSLRKPYLQIGIFGVEANARGAVSSMRRKGAICIDEQTDIEQQTVLARDCGTCGNVGRDVRHAPNSDSRGIC